MLVVVGGGEGHKDSLMSRSQGLRAGPAWPLTYLHCFPPWCSQPELFSGTSLVGLGLWQGKACLQKSIWLPDPQQLLAYSASEKGPAMSRFWYKLLTSL